jgi:hypothetical protein
MSDPPSISEPENDSCCTDDLTLLQSIWSYIEAECD